MNHMNQINRVNHMNHINHMNQINHMNHINHMNNNNNKNKLKYNNNKIIIIWYKNILIWVIKCFDIFIFNKFILFFIYSYK